MPYMFNDPIPDCVPEFYRQQQEAADTRYERQARDQKRYAANRAKIQAAATSGLPVLPYGGYDRCRKCASADSDTMTDAEDDMDYVICRNPSCRLHKLRRGTDRHST